MSRQPESGALVEQQPVQRQNPRKSDDSKGKISETAIKKTGSVDNCTGSSKIMSLGRWFRELRGSKSASCSSDYSSGSLEFDSSAVHAPVIKLSRAQSALVGKSHYQQPQKDRVRHQDGKKSSANSRKRNVENSNITSRRYSFSGRKSHLASIFNDRQSNVTDRFNRLCEGDEDGFDDEWRKKEPIKTTVHLTKREGSDRLHEHSVDCSSVDNGILKSSDVESSAVNHHSYYYGAQNRKRNTKQKTNSPHSERTSRPKDRISGHEKYPSWPESAPISTDADASPVSNSLNLTSNSSISNRLLRTDSELDLPSPKIKFPAKRVTPGFIQQLKTVMEKCEKASMEMFESSVLEDEEARSRGKIYLPHADSVDSIFSSERPSSPSERDVSSLIKSHLLDNDFSQYNHSYQDSSYLSQDGDYAECYSEEAGRTQLTKAELEQYEKAYEDTYIRPSHQKQSSYAQSEGYHSYVSSNDSAIITPLLDRLRREDEVIVSVTEDCGNGGKEKNKLGFGDNNGPNGILPMAGRESSASASSGSSSDTLKWHGSLSDVSVASSYRSSNAQLIAHSSRVQTPQRHHSESVLYLGSGAAGGGTNSKSSTANGSAASNSKDVGNTSLHRNGDSSAASRQVHKASSKSPHQPKSSNGQVRKLSPITSYTAQQISVPTSNVLFNATSHSSSSTGSSVLAPNSLTVAQRIIELEKQQQEQHSKKYTYFDPDKRHKVTDHNLKVIQKKALLSYYERHHSAWRSEPQLSSMPVPSQSPLRPRLPTPTSRPPSAEECSSTSSNKKNGVIDDFEEPVTITHNRTSSAGDINTRNSAIDSSSNGVGNNVSQQKDTLARNLYSSSCGSLPATESGPVIVGPSISVDDWVPELPPKKAHLRSPITPQRIASPDLPPPPSPPTLDDEVFVSDEPLPPPPPEVMNASCCPADEHSEQTNASFSSSSLEFSSIATHPPRIHQDLSAIKTRRSLPPDVVLSSSGSSSGNGESIAVQHSKKYHSDYSGRSSKDKSITGRAKEHSRLASGGCSADRNFEVQKSKSIDLPKSPQPQMPTRANLASACSNSATSLSSFLDSISRPCDKLKLPTEYDYSEINKLVESKRLHEILGADKYADGSMNYYPPKDSFVRSASVRKDKLVTTNDRGNKDFSAKKAVFVNGYERQSLRYSSQKTTQHISERTRSAVGRYIQNHNGNSVRGSGNKMSGSASPVKYKIEAAFRRTDAFIDKSNASPTLNSLNYHQSQSSYRREPREREKGMPNCEGSYKRTMSPSSLNQQSNGISNGISNGLTSRTNNCTKDIENIEPSTGTSNLSEIISRFSSNGQANHIMKMGHNNNNNNNNNKMNSSEAFNKIGKYCVSSAASHQQPLNRNDNIVLSRSVSSRSESDDAQRLAVPPPAEHSQTLPRNYAMPTMAALSTSITDLGPRRNVRSPRTHSDPTVLPNNSSSSNISNSNGANNSSSSSNSDGNETEQLGQSSSSLGLSHANCSSSNSPLSSNTMPRSQSDLSTIGSTESGYSSLSLNVPSPSSSPTRLSSNDRNGTAGIFNVESSPSDVWCCVETQCDINPSSSEQTPVTDEQHAAKTLQRSEIVLRIGATTSDASSQTETVCVLNNTDEQSRHLHGCNRKTASAYCCRDSSTSPMFRQKLQEEIDCEELSRDLISHLPPSDKLHGILAPKPDAKTSMDYVSNLFQNSSTVAMSRSRFSFPLNSDGTPCASHRQSEDTSLHEGSLTRIGYTLSSPSTEKPTNVVSNCSSNTPQLASQSLSSLQKKKEELMCRLDRKLNILREEQVSIMEECRINDVLGNMVSEKVHTVASAHEAAKFKIHVEEIGHITSLLLGLSGRLARVENSLLELSEDHRDRKLLESKRDKLAAQLEEAKALKENIDRRSKSLSVMLHRYFTEDEFADYSHFVNMKSKLLIDSREISDKIQLGEEQLTALRETLLNDN